MHAGAGQLQHRTHERDGGSLAVGSGIMEDWRQALLRMTEPAEHMPHAIKRKIDALGMQRQEPRQDGVYLRLGHWCVVAFRQNHYLPGSAPARCSESKG